MALTILCATTGAANVDSTPEVPSFFVFVNFGAFTNTFGTTFDMPGKRSKTPLEDKPYRRDIQGWYYEVPGSSDIQGRCSYKNYAHPAFTIQFVKNPKPSENYRYPRECWSLLKNDEVLLRDSTHGPGGCYKGIRPDRVFYNDIRLYPSADFQKLTEGASDWSEHKCINCPGVKFVMDEKIVNGERCFDSTVHASQKSLKGKNVAYTQTGYNNVGKNLLCQPCWKEVTDAMAKCPRSNNQLDGADANSKKRKSGFESYWARQGITVPDTQANSVSACKSTQADNDAADSASFLTSYSGIALMSVGALATVVLLVYFCCASSTEEVQEDVDYGAFV